MPLSNTNISFSSINTELFTIANTFSFVASGANVQFTVDRVVVPNTAGLSNGYAVQYVCNTVNGIIPGLVNNQVYYVYTGSSAWGPHFSLRTTPDTNTSFVDLTDDPAVNNTQYLLPVANQTISLSNTLIRALGNTANATGGPVILTNYKNASRSKTYSNSAVTSSAARFVFDGAKYYDLPYANGTAWQIRANTSNYDAENDYYIWNWGAIDYFLYNTDVFEDARNQYGNLTFTIRVAYNYTATDENLTYFAVIPFIKPVNYNPPTGFTTTDYGNQLSPGGNPLYLSSGTVISTVGSIRTRDLSWTAPLAKGVSLGADGGWSISTDGQWNLGKINNTGHALTLSARHVSFTSSTAILNFRVIQASMSGSYDV